MNDKIRSSNIFQLIIIFGFGFVNFYPKSNSETIADDSIFFWEKFVHKGRNSIKIRESGKGKVGEERE